MKPAFRILIRINLPSRLVLRSECIVGRARRIPIRLRPNRLALRPQSFAFVGKLISARILIALFLLSSCIDGRSYITTRHSHLHYEVEVQRNIRREIRVTHAIQGERLNLQFQEISFCRHVQFDVEKMSLIRTQTRPGAGYYMLLGSLIAALSIPSYYMGFANSSGTARAIHLSVGTGIFLGPGLTIGGYGLWKRLEENTTTEDAGNVRREVKSTDFSCGKALPSEGARVEVLTRIGHVPLGTLPTDGRITADLSRLQPLRSEETGKTYLDVFVDAVRVGTIVLSDPMNTPSNR